MRIAIFGATGRAGTVIARQASEQGHSVTMHARSEDNGLLLEQYGEVVVGSLDEAQVFLATISGADAVISALGTTIRKPNTVLSDITASIIEQMAAARVTRFVCITSLGCGKSFEQVSGRIMRWLIKGIGKEIWADKERQENRIINSELDYLIVRPGGLSKKPAKGAWTAVSETDPVTTKQMIPIEDVAAYCLSECVETTAHRQAVTLLSGKV